MNKRFKRTPIIINNTFWSKWNKADNYTKFHPVTSFVYFACSVPGMRCYYVCGVKGLKRNIKHKQLKPIYYHG